MRTALDNDVRVTDIVDSAMTAATHKPDVDELVRRVERASEDGLELRRLRRDVHGRTDLTDDERGFVLGTIGGYLLMLERELGDPIP